MKMILASASPRRHELLTAAGFEFTVHAPDIDETIAPGTSPRHAARGLARQKAEAVAALYPGACVIAADTIVGIDGEPANKDKAQRTLQTLFGEDLDNPAYEADVQRFLRSYCGEILGKPMDEANAVHMLKLLSGREHTVFTGVCIITGKTDGILGTSYTDETHVQFFTLSDDEIARYVATGEPMDKAGAYGIQGRGAMLVKGITGDFYNVMGLPVSAMRHLREFA
ncbi:MAG: Maf family protein [Oscillospiraceae bacterium]|nr:Maf family protein [Oscillospiraceae bacterium]